MTDFEKMARNALAARQTAANAAEVEAARHAQVQADKRKEQKQVFDTFALPTLRKAAAELTRANIEAEIPNVSRVAASISEVTSASLIVGHNKANRTEHRMAQVDVSCRDGAWLIATASLKNRHEPRVFAAASNEVVADAIAAAVEDAVARWTETGDYARR